MQVAQATQTTTNPYRTVLQEYAAYSEAVGPNLPTQPAIEHLTAALVAAADGVQLLTKLAEQTDELTGAKILDAAQRAQTLLERTVDYVQVDAPTFPATTYAPDQRPYDPHVAELTQLAETVDVLQS